MKAYINSEKVKEIIKEYYWDEEGKDVDVYIYAVNSDRNHPGYTSIKVKDYVNIAGHNIERSDYIGDDELINIMNYFLNGFTVGSLKRICKYETEEYFTNYKRIYKFVGLELEMYKNKLDQVINRKPNVKRK